VLDFLKVEGIRIVAQDLLDVCPRKVHFFVDSGKVQVKRLSLTPSEPVQMREREYLKRLAGRTGGEVELFSAPR
jgi:chemotaxis protein CheD